MPVRTIRREPYPKAWLKVLLLRSLDDGLSLVETRVLLALYAHTDKDGIAFPSIKTLAEFAGCTTRPQRVRDALRRLSQLGFHVVTKKGGGHGKPTVRRMIFDRETGDGASPVSEMKNGCPRVTLLRDQEQVTPGRRTGDAASPIEQVTTRRKQVTRRHPEVAIEGSRGSSRKDPESRCALRARLGSKVRDQEADER